MAPPATSTSNVADAAENANRFRILVATDIHLGFAEKDPLRSKDATNTFEEILALASKEDVDFLLLGGDLFHENKPSRQILNDCIHLLRKYCLSDHPIRFEYLSDPSVNFDQTLFPSVNYEDLNLNIGLPIFSINGNHDDLTSHPPLCALDLLHTAGLLNYFGKVTTMDKFVVAPLLFRKGATNLAIYGFGAIHDERLHRLFAKDLVQFLRPREEPDRWFSILVLHQNHVKHGEKNYIPEGMIPGFFDLVIWGHEHPCFIEPVQGPKNFFVTQPGSSVATSLAAGEAREKAVGLLIIEDKKFQLKKRPLQTVRQFCFEEIRLRDFPQLTAGATQSGKQVEKFLHEKVEQTLTELDSSRLPSQPKEPLIRFRVDASGGYETFNVPRFGLKFQQRVANTKDIILWHTAREKREGVAFDADAMESIIGEADALMGVGERVEDLVKKYFAEVDEAKRLTLLTDTGIGEAVKEFVDKDEKDSIALMVKHQLKRGQERLIGKKLQDEGAIVEFLREERARRTRLVEVEEEEQARRLLEKNRDFRPKQEKDDSDAEMDSIAAGGDPVTLNGKAAAKKRLLDIDDDAASEGSSVRGRRVSAIARVESDDELDDTLFERDAPAGAPKTRGGRATRGRAPPKRGGRRAAVNVSDDDVEIVSIESDEDYGARPKRRAAKKSPPKKRGRK